MRFLVLPIFDGVIMVGHPISWHPPQLKFECPSFMTPLKMGKQKLSSFILILIVRIVLLLHFIGRILFVKNIVTSFH